MYQRIICVFCALAITFTSVFPAHAEPVVNEVTAAEVSGQTGTPTPPLTPTHPIYFPLISKPQCYKLTSLTPSASSEQCAALAPYVGTQGPSTYIATVDGEHASMFDTDMPQVRVHIPLTGTHIGPQSSGIVSSRIIRLSAISYMTDTTGARNTQAINDAPFAGRIGWVIRNALEDKNDITPQSRLFPVSIAILHYSQPQLGANFTTIFEKCSGILSPGQFALPGMPYDMIIDDAMTRGGNVWLRMLYPSCPAISGYYIKLSSFWQHLKVYAEYQHIEAEAAAIAGPSTYHVTNLQMKMPDGQVLLIGATIVVVAIGTVVIIAIFPEVGVGWWLLSGTAVLTGQAQQEEKRW